MSVDKPSLTKRAEMPKISTKRQEAQLLPVESSEMVGFYMMCREYHNQYAPTAKSPIERRTALSSPPSRPVSFGIRIEGQRPEETLEQAEARIDRENKIFFRSFTTSLVIVGAFLIGGIILTAFK